MLEGCTPYPGELVDEYKAKGYWNAQTLGELLDASALCFTDHVALHDGEKMISYRELMELSARLAVHIYRRGLRPRDIVLLQLPNCWEFYVVFFALMKIGVLPVLCLPPHRNAELNFFARLTGARAYFFTEQFRKFDYLVMAREIQGDSPRLEYLIATGDGTETGVDSLARWLEEPVDATETKDFLKEVMPDPFDVAFFLLSGGTTGVPKLIPRTHADYIHNALACAEVLGWDEMVVFLVVIPSAHNFPLGAPGMVGALSVGGSVAICPIPAPARIFETIERSGGTFLAVSPALLIMLLNSPERSKYDLSSLRFICGGGQKMLPELVERTKAVWSWVQVGHAFGMAEGLVNLTRPGDSWEVIRETQGKPCSPGDEVRVVDEASNLVPEGEVGELLTRGPYTIRGYYKAEEHNRTAFTPDGFYRTGDMVRIHPSGNLVVEGRKKDMINRGGEKISAEEVENLILAHESVHMVAVVAMPDEVMGEKSCAFVIPRPGRGLTLEQLCAFLLDQRIAKFKLPERLELTEQFPLTGVGKVSKRELREILHRKLLEEARLAG
jgi:2,3-dihydroxybenzoate-AMP ligase